MKDIKAKILSNKEIAPGYFRMALDAPYIARHAKPGQFVQVRCSEGLEPLLRRPFSIHRIPSIEILYEVVGRATGILSEKHAGEFVDVLGPLGNGFTLPRNTEYGIRNTVLIAGGIGIAPLVFLAEKLAKKRIKTTVLMGAKTKKQILCEKDLKKIGTEVHIATDDGSHGCKGFVSELFQKVLRATNNEQRPKGVPSEVEGRTTIYACGPTPMLKCIADICKKQKLECLVSLEEMMACGIGACLGCAVKVKDGGYKLACKDGPVFNADEIIWS
ncbi:MAG: dihydroorotate dehydrogenase electron transfer subunit [Candidatus Omnitrophica bacterium]|nr:dihydroorotate dehydrogenase electron transfer subunit [Candidatus Omnitrophota bacterium]